MATSKEWHTRASWSLDELANEMARHFGYPDRTALLKSMIRGCALVGATANHSLLLRLARESPAMQDKIDAEMLRRWRAKEVVMEGPLTEMAKRVMQQTGVPTNYVMNMAAEDIIEKVRVEV